MGKKLKKITGYIWRHKYLWTTLIFLVIVGFVDANSFWNRYELARHNRQLREEIARFEAQYERETRELDELNSNPEAVEQVARVRLFMKTADEDVYVLE